MAHNKSWIFVIPIIIALVVGLVIASAPAHNAVTPTPNLGNGSVQPSANVTPTKALPNGTPSTPAANGTWTKILVVDGKNYTETGPIGEVNQTPVRYYLPSNATIGVVVSNTSGNGSSVNTGSHPLNYTAKGDDPKDATNVTSASAPTSQTYPGAIVVNHTYYASYRNQGVITTITDGPMAHATVVVELYMWADGYHGLTVGMNYSLSVALNVSVGPGSFEVGQGNIFTGQPVYYQFNMAFPANMSGSFPMGISVYADFPLTSGQGGTDGYSSSLTLADGGHYTLNLGPI